jgi:hypothetical protein
MRRKRTKAGRAHVPIAAGDVGRPKANGPGRRTRTTDVCPESIVSANIERLTRSTKPALAVVGWYGAVFHTKSHAAVIRPCNHDLLLELKLTQPFDKALVLDLVVSVLKFHHEFFLLQTTERIFRCI